VPLAATIWILPLQCYVFHYVPLYGIFTNIVTTPLVLIITLGGFISAFVGLLIPVLGSAIAYLLFPFIGLLIKIVDFSLNLPFSSLAVGEINIFQLVIVYAVFLLICFNKNVRKHGLFLVVATLISIIVPLIYQKLNLVQITVFNNNYPSTVIIQNANQNALLNLGDKDSIRFQIIPFLRSQGINKIELISAQPDNEQQKSFNYFQGLNISNQGKTSYVQEKHNNFWFEVGNKRWLLMSNNSNITSNNETIADVLIGNHQEIDLNIIKQLRPETVITNSTINEQILTDFSSNQIQLLSTKNNIIQWNPQTGFKQYHN
jgi:competence protein ComEC